MYMLLDFRRMLFRSWAVLLGTLYPLFIDALGMGKISVGPPYFNLVFVPLMVPALLLIAVGPVANWKRAKLRDVLKQLNLPLFVAVVAGVGVPFLYGRWSALVALGIALAAWIATAVVMGIFKRMRATRSGLLAQPRSWMGMHIALLGTAVLLVGVSLVMVIEIEQAHRL